MWDRLAAAPLRRLWGQLPAVLIVGARQVGKTTLARRTFPRLKYVDLEEPRTRERFQDDPTFELERFRPASLVLDEAQAVPSLFPALRSAIDQHRRKAGQFLLLGSAQPALVRHVSESLAGRIGVMELAPLTAGEAGKGWPKRSWTSVWLRGGFPDALRHDFRDWWESYLRTYVERDLPQLGVAANPLLLRRLLTMLAHAQGGLFNASAVGQALGVTYHTVQRYVDVLEQTFLVRRLPPFHRNVRKRLVKSPKVYVRDTGLVHHLLNLGTAAEVASHPVAGASFETFVVEDLLRREALARPHTQAYFWRTATGIEADLVLDRGSERVLIEVKTGRGDRPAVTRALAQSMRDVGARAAWIIDQGTVVESVAPDVERRGIEHVIGWLPPVARRRTRRRARRSTGARSS
jgi:predicted AAA+ superfamily ATPase